MIVWGTWREVSAWVAHASGGLMEWMTSFIDCLICNIRTCFVRRVSKGSTGQGWLHRRCAGLTRPAVEKLGDPDTQYFCLHCAFINYSKEISNLANIVKELNTNIRSLTKTMSSLQSHVIKRSHQMQQPSVSPPMASPWLSSTFSDRKFYVVWKTQLNGHNFKQILLFSLQLLNKMNLQLLLSQTQLKIWEIPLLVKSSFIRWSLSN